MDNKKQQIQLPVPIFQDNTETYESWRKDVEKWCFLSSLPPAKKAFQIYFSLTSKAKIASNQMPNEKLTVKLLLENLD